MQLYAQVTSTLHTPKNRSDLNTKTQGHLLGNNGPLAQREHRALRDLQPWPKLRRHGATVH